MGIGIDLRKLFQNTYSVNDQAMENIFDFINASIAVAAKEKPKEFLARRSRIIEALLTASPVDDVDQDCSISSSSDFSCESLLDEDLDDQFDGVTSASSKPINLSDKEKVCGIIQSNKAICTSMVLNDENKDRGKKIQKRIETEDPKHKIDARSGNKGLSLDEVKFEKPSLDIEKVKKKVQIGVKEKGCGIIQSVSFDEENKGRGKKFQRKTQTEDAKHKIDTKSGNKGLSLDKVKFEATKRKFEKGCGIIQSATYDEENKDRGKKFQRKIKIEDTKHKIDARSGNKGLSLDEVKFEATKRKFEETSLDIKNGKRKIQILDFKDIPQSKPIVDENRFNRGGFEKSSFRRR
ncbi:Hypothetical predicted protein [Olea europaea subsp. europaea]|uniref:Uncharacterized protein n=1 Tax=Olea europaea subsp. europaea TaxID=158383 RepID=A0A8S0QWM8_OLEEU|nr:Hypothetical predicted protein [Olea europaea subsp. europaea]